LFFDYRTHLFSASLQEVTIMSPLFRALSFCLVFSPFIASDIASVNKVLGGEGLTSFFGASMAITQVTDTWAMLRQHLPTASVTEVLNGLRASGVKTTNIRSGTTIPSINTNVSLQPGCFPSIPAGNWRGGYFTGSPGSGPTVMFRDHGNGFLNFNVGTNSPSLSCPHPNGMAADGWSVRFTRGPLNFTAGTYRFSATVDGSVRISVNGQLILDKSSQAPTTFTADIALTAGNYSLMVDYSDTGGPASLSLSWANVTHCFANVPQDQWKGEYYNNTNLTGNPMMVRNDGTGFLNLNFGVGSPSAPCSLPVDNFSARFTQIVNFAPGIYRFSVTVDDGVRLYVAGHLKIDKWFDQAPTTYTADVTIAAGNHEVKLEYYERSNGAMIQLSWTNLCLANVPEDRWKGEYYNNTNLTGNPMMVRDDTGSLNLNFGNASPNAGCGLGADNFSARWTRTINFTPGNYRFFVTVDDGVRLYVGGQLLIDKWFIQAPTTYTADVSLTEGNHEVKLEFVEYTGGAMISLFWGDPNCLANVPTDRWRGEYYNNPSLAGFPMMVRNDGVGFLNFDFGTGSPSAACGLGVDNFSVRWMRMVNFAQQSTYRFTVTVDDGVRLYVDGQLKIDKWIDQGPTTYTADVELSAGDHEVKLEYYEGGLTGVAFLSWSDVTGVNCVPNVPLPLISSVSQTGGREIIASTAPSKLAPRCIPKNSD
jgi:hypothetical protein